jgi:hypothetical protein
MSLTSWNSPLWWSMKILLGRAYSLLRGFSLFNISQQVTPADNATFSIKKGNAV